MTTKRRRYLVCAAFALLTLASCTQEEDFSPTPQGNDLSMGVLTEIAGAVATRAGTEMTHLQTNGFVFSAIPEGSNSGDDYYYKDMQVKYDATTNGWQFYKSGETTPTELFWKDTKTTANFTASYPTGTWTLNADQSTEEKYTANDWLSFAASKTHSETTNGKVPITFQHANAKLVVNITLASGNFPNGSEIKDVLITGTNIEDYGEATNITPYKNGTSYEAILLPQKADLGVSLVVNDKTYTWSQAETELISGYVYTLNLVVRKPIAIGEVTVEDWNTATDNIDDVAKDDVATGKIDKTGKIATIDITENVSAASIETTVKKALGAGCTTIIVNGEVSEEQQGGIASAFSGATLTNTIILILPGTTTVSSQLTSLANIDLAHKNGTGANGYAKATDGTYLITGKAGLDAWRSAASSNTSTNLTLMCDIEYNGDWQLLGPNYYGTIDGNGYAIKGLSCNNTNSYAAFIEILYGTIKHLGMEGGSFSSNFSSDQNHTGSIAVANHGTIMGCYNTSSINADNIYQRREGGITALNYGVIIGCYNSGQVTVNALSGGGIAGMNLETYANIISCYNTGEVIKTDEESESIIGAVVGDNTWTVSLGAMGSQTKYAKMSACYYAEKGISGIGYGSIGTSTQSVSGSNWSAAMNAMNAAIVTYNNSATVKCNYRFAENKDASTKSSQPLIIVKVAE